MAFTHGCWFLLVSFLGVIVYHEDSHREYPFGPFLRRGGFMHFTLTLKIRLYFSGSLGGFRAGLWPQRWYFTIAILG